MNLSHLINIVCKDRDLARSELLGLDRFIPVRSAERRLMTCFLEYETQAPSSSTTWSTSGTAMAMGLFKRAATESFGYLWIGSVTNS